MTICESMTYSDCNVHLDLFPCPISIIKEYNYFKVKKIITLCHSLYSFKFLSGLLGNMDSVSIGIGLHPNVVYSKEEKSIVLSLLSSKVNILGECGLDFTKNVVTHKIQKENLLRQLNIAERYRNIVIIHIKNAENKLIEILDSYKKFRSLIIHWYSGSKSSLAKLIDKNCYFAFNRSILNSRKYQEYITKIPLQNLLLESDAPIKFKGKITKPEDFPIIIAKIAEIKRENISYVLKKLQCNFKAIFDKELK